MVRTRFSHSGNYDGIGKVREKELSESCKVLDIVHHECINDEKLQDGPTNMWDHSIIQKHVNDFVKRNSIDMVRILTSSRL